jgi:DNA-binding HxlR family transcriptional regulator
MEKQLDAQILKALSGETLGYRQIMDKTHIADRPLRRRMGSLIKHGYVSRPSRNWKRGNMKRHSITKRGVSYYEEIRDVAAIQRVATELGDWRIATDDERAAAAFVDLFLSLFRLTYTRYHKAGDIKIYDAFISRAEMAIQNFLNERLADDRGNMNGSLRWPYREFYMGIISRPSEALREDGKLAYRSGHGLKQWHVDLLCDQLRLYSKESLLLHNQDWLERKKGLNLDRELEKEFKQRRAKLKKKYPTAYGKMPFGLDSPAQRGVVLAFANSKNLRKRSLSSVSASI